MWCSEGSVLRFSRCFLVQRLHNLFLLRGCTILCVEKLHDFCVWRGCVIFPTHSLRLPDLFVLRFFFAERLSDIFVERLHDSLYEEVTWFLVWRGCVTFCLKRFFRRRKSLPVKSVFLVKKKKLVKQFFGWNNFLFVKF